MDAYPYSAEKSDAISLLTSVEWFHWFVLSKYRRLQMDYINAFRPRIISEQTFHASWPLEVKVKPGGWF